MFKIGLLCVAVIVVVAGGIALWYSIGHDDFAAMRQASGQALQKSEAGSGINSVPGPPENSDAAAFEFRLTEEPDADIEPLIKRTRDLSESNAELEAVEVLTEWYLEWLKNAPINDDGAYHLRQPESNVFLVGIAPDGFMLVSYRDAALGSMRLGILDPETGLVTALSPPGRSFLDVTYNNASARVIYAASPAPKQITLFEVDMDGNERAVYSFPEGDVPDCLVSHPTDATVYCFVQDPPDFSRGRFVGVDLVAGEGFTLAEVEGRCKVMTCGPGPREITFSSYGRGKEEERLQVLSFSGATPEVRYLMPNAYGKLMDSFDTGIIRHLSWLPGNEILSVVAAGNGVDSQVYLLYGDGQEPLQVTRSGAQSAMWSPDGKWMYFHAPRRDAYLNQLYALPVGPAVVDSGGAN